MTFKVTIRPLAAADLDDIYEFIARDSPKNAIGFVRRIRMHCESLTSMPERGPRRDDLAPGIRVLPFERRTVIAYRIDGRIVRILSVFYGGRDYPREWVED